MGLFVQQQGSGCHVPGSTFHLSPPGHSFVRSFPGSQTQDTAPVISHPCRALPFNFAFGSYRLRRPENGAGARAQAQAAGRTTLGPWDLGTVETLPLIWPCLGPPGTRLSWALASPSTWACLGPPPHPHLRTPLPPGHSPFLRAHIHFSAPHHPVAAHLFPSNSPVRSTRPNSTFVSPSILLLFRRKCRVAESLLLFPPLNNISISHTTFLDTLDQ